MELLPGSYVFSKAGRDKGKCLLVLKSEGDYVLLCDGKTRKLKKPKRKKIKHVIPTGYVDEELKRKISEGLEFFDKEVKRRIALFLSKNSPID